MSAEYPDLSCDQYIAELRKDIRDTAADRDSNASAVLAASVAVLEEAAKAASMPDAAIKVQLRAIRLALFG